MGAQTQAVMQDAVTRNLQAVHKGEHWGYFVAFGARSSKPEFWAEVADKLREKELAAAEALCIKYGVDPVPFRPSFEERVTVQGTGELRRVTIHNTDRTVKPAGVGDCHTYAGGLSVVA